MGTQTGFDPNVLGPFGALFQTYFTALDTFGQGSKAFGGTLGSPAAFDSEAATALLAAPLKVAARCQLEMLGLASRRAQAYLQVPTRLAQCRTPQDVVNEQMAFWRTAAEQYGTSGRKIGEAWAQMFPWLTAGAGRQTTRERDYINFNGTGGEAGAGAEPTARQRRVA